MSKNKSPNCECKICKKQMIRKPSQIKNNVYCSKECLWIDRGKLQERPCDSCGKSYKPNKRNSKYCCRKCTNIGRKGIVYSKRSDVGFYNCNKSRKRLKVLKDVFDFKHCMVENCDYNKTYDIHRLIEGQNGGEYEIGNMFAICPNHHAEAHRGLIKLKKINDYTLAAKPIPIIHKICPTCKVQFLNDNKYCSIKCSTEARSRIKIKNKIELENLIKSVELNGYTATGKMLGVSDNGIRWWIKKQKNILHSSSGQS